MIHTCSTATAKLTHGIVFDKGYAPKTLCGRAPVDIKKRKFGGPLSCARCLSSIMLLERK